MSYPYQKLTREESTGVRYYVCPESGQLVPSVTTILDATANKEFLIEWRKRIGEEAADKQVKYASNIGTLVHSHMEAYILGDERPPSGPGVKPMFKLAKQMADQIIKHGMPSVTKIYGCEVGLFFPSLYAGTSDLVGEHNGDPAIIDFKNSKKIKKREWVHDYFCQGCAYAQAHNAVYGTNINKVVLFMVDRVCEFHEFVLEGAEFEEFSLKWCQRVDDYYNSVAK